MEDAGYHTAAFGLRVYADVGFASSKVAKLPLSRDLLFAGIVRGLAKWQ
jgi:hypothetical protein